MNLKHLPTYLMRCSFVLVLQPLRDSHSRIQRHRKLAFNTLPRRLARCPVPNPRI